MRRIQMAAVIGLLLVLASVGLAAAQTGYQTQFQTAITYQNISSSAAVVTFSFYNEKTASAVVVTRNLNANAGASLAVGSLTGSEALPSNFLGSAILGSSQPVVATLVQLPQPSTGSVRNRPMSNGFSSGSSQVLLATVLKGAFNTNSKFSIQNASDGAVDITVQFFAVGQTSPALTLNESNIPVGAAKYYDMGALSGLSSPFDGSATVTAVRTGTTTPANIVGSVLELQTSGVGVRAFEGVPNTAAANTVYMATALCGLGGQTTAYAVQNTSSSQSAAVTVTYSNGMTQQGTIGAGGKQSFNSCNALPQSFSGAATITSNGAPIVVIAKVGGAGRYTAFLGETSGSAKLALPYARWSNTKYDSGQYQRAAIAIQNISNSAVSNVRVRYLNKEGTEVGVHTIASIPALGKANSNATLAGSTVQLTEFGNPEANPGGGFGGSVIVEGPAGSQLIAVVRISSNTSTGVVAEDYNGIAIQ
ncbi:MAG: hypothetical protein ACKO4U_10965 [Caldilinea sp.]